MRTVFLSYSSKDQEFVNRLAIDLESKGFKVWYDQWQLDSFVGTSLFEKIQEGIKQASWLVIVLSPNATESKWVKEELNFGIARQLADSSIFVLPVLYKDTEIPAFLRDKVYADFRIDYYAGLRRLIATLKRQYFDSILIKPVSTLTTDADRNFRELIKAEGLDFFSGMWRGLTGRLTLSKVGEQIEGKYDWQGYDFSGHIKGTIRSDIPINAIVFDWHWKITGEMGKGIFYLSNPEILFGGWWMNYDLIDPEELVTKSVMPPNHWMFRKSDLSLALLLSELKRRLHSSNSALECINSAIEMKESIYGSVHPSVAECLKIKEAMTKLPKSPTHKEKHAVSRENRSHAQKHGPTKIFKAHRPSDKRYRKGQRRGRR